MISSNLFLIFLKLLLKINQIKFQLFQSDQIHLEYILIYSFMF